MVQTTGRGVLRELRLRRQGVSRGKMLVERVSLGQKFAGDSFEQVLVCHCAPPLKANRRVVNRVEMIKVFCPELPAPSVRELLRALLSRKAQPLALRLFIDHLQVAHLMQKNFVQKKSADRQQRPLLSALCAELLAPLSWRQSACKAQARRKRADGDIAAPFVYVAQKPIASGLVVEVNGAQSLPGHFRQAAQDHHHVCFSQIVSPAAAGNRG